MRVFVGPAYSLSGKVAAPGSKNYTSRYIWASALADGESVVLSPAKNDDASALIACCQELGAEIRYETENRLRITGFGKNHKMVEELDPGNGGLILRLLLAFGLFLPEVTYQTAYTESLGKRPQGDLLEALRDLGAQVEDDNGCLPIIIRGNKPLLKREVEVSGKVSSQFATALMFVAPIVGGLTISIKDGLSSWPPLATTGKVMKEYGIPIEADWQSLTFKIPAGQYQPGVFQVPGDYPAASALLAASALVRSKVTITNLFPDDEQGEKATLFYLVSMGADLKYNEEGKEVTINGGGALQAKDFYGNKAIDSVLSMAVVATIASGTTRFFNIGNLRWKESDRIGDFARELRKVGVNLREHPEGLEIVGNPGGYQGGVTIDAHQDHRMVMAFSALALCTREGLTIDGAEHVKKSYPDFFSDLGSLGATVKVLSV